MSNFSAFEIPGKPPGTTVRFETQSQDPTTAVPVPSIAAANAPAINPPMDWGGHRLVRTTNHGDLTHKTPPRSGSASPVGGAAKAAAPEPDDSGDDRMVTDESGSASPVRSQLPFTQDLDSPVPEKRPKGVFRNSGEGGLYAAEKALIEQIIASAGPVVVGLDESEDRTDYTKFPRRKLAGTQFLKQRRQRSGKTEVSNSRKNWVLHKTAFASSRKCF